MWGAVVAMLAVSATFCCCFEGIVLARGFSNHWLGYIDTSEGELLSSVGDPEGGTSCEACSACRELEVTRLDHKLDERAALLVLSLLRPEAEVVVVRLLALLLLLDEAE
jgi:hypothetical protein